MVTPSATELIGAEDKPSPNGRLKLGRVLDPKFSDRLMIASKQ